MASNASKKTKATSAKAKVAKKKAADKKKKKSKGSDDNREFCCPLCPDDPPYAGASGLWYHKKRHHGAVTRPYNSKKRREKIALEGEVLISSDESGKNNTPAPSQKETQYVNKLAGVLNANDRVKEVLDKTASFDPMLFLSQIAVLQERVSKGEESGMSAAEAVVNESQSMKTPSPTRPRASLPTNEMVGLTDLLLCNENLLFLNESASTNPPSGAKRTLQVFLEQEQKESPKEHDQSQKKLRASPTLENIIPSMSGEYEAFVKKPNGKHVFLGSFPTQNEAIVASRSAQLHLGPDNDGAKKLLMQQYNAVGLA